MRKLSCLRCGLRALVCSDGLLPSPVQTGWVYLLLGVSKQSFPVPGLLGSVRSDDGGDITFGCQTVCNSIIQSLC